MSYLRPRCSTSFEAILGGIFSRNRTNFENHHQNFDIIFVQPLGNAVRFEIDMSTSDKSFDSQKLVFDQFIYGPAILGSLQLLGISIRGNL